MKGDKAFISRTGCHWAIFLGPIVAVTVGTLLLKARPYDGAGLMAFGLLWGTFSLIARRRTEIGLTPERLLIHAGFPVPKAYEIPLEQIGSIEFYQPALGSIFDFGKLLISYQGDKSCIIRFVSSPAQFTAEVREQMAPSPPSPEA